jgi:hypothetical protein
MARKDRNQMDEKFEEIDSEAVAEAAEVTEPAGTDLSGLVKMHKDGRHIHAHPSVVKHHESNGWKLV